MAAKTEKPILEKMVGVTVFLEPGFFSSIAETDLAKISFYRTHLLVKLKLFSGERNYDVPYGEIDCLRDRGLLYGIQILKKDGTSVIFREFSNPYTANLFAEIKKAVAKNKLKLKVK